MEAKAVAISHDAFGRYSILRKRAVVIAPCEWCGNAGKWNFGDRSDDSLACVVHWSRHNFCSVSCYRTWVR